MPPTGHDIEVATDALRRDGAVWVAQQAAMNDLSRTATTLGFDHRQAGIFLGIVTAHAELAAMVAARCAEGSVEMGTVAATLTEAAFVYDDEERRHLHALYNLY